LVTLYKEIRPWPGKQNDAETKLGTGSIEELTFWDQNLLLVNGSPLRDPIQSVTLRVDAGECGFGGKSEFGEYAAALPAELIGQSSTKRELYGLIETASAMVKSLQNRHVLIEMDSFAAIRNLVKGGGPKPELCDLDDVVQTKQHHMLLPLDTEENKEADRLSKLLDQQWQPQHGGVQSQ
jgi:hypothetical protein